MTTYILRRLALTVPVLFGVTLLVFSMLHLVPGDPVKAMFIESGGASAEQIEQVRHLLGLDKPLPEQYWDYVTNALHGDLGQSIISKRPVFELIVQNLPSTLQLTITGLGLAIVLGMALGVVAAVRHTSWIDNTMMVLATSRRTVQMMGSRKFVVIWRSTPRCMPMLSNRGLSSSARPSLCARSHAAAVAASRSSSRRLLWSRERRTSW